MKNIVLSILVMFVGVLYAQSYEYKKGILVIDGEDVAKITMSKEYIGLANTFEVFNMNDEKIIHAAYAAEYEADESNTLDFYYQLDFVTLGQTGIFPLGKLSTEKSLANLLGKNGIFIDGQLDASKVSALISSKGKNPKKIISYTVVNRNTGWPIVLKEGGIIEQDGKIIGSFKDVTNGGSTDKYEFYLPSKVLVAKASFTNGNNSQYCELLTPKDNLNRTVQTPTNETVNGLITAGDRNEIMLKRIIKWMIANGYM